MSEAPQARSSVSRIIDLTGATAGRFVIQRRLGSGGMGEVYLAEDPKLRRLVAIKRMSPGNGLEQQDLARILREGQRASALNHPNIANVYDVLEEADGELFLVMEYIEGTPLRDHLNTAYEVEHFYPIAAQCADALAAAHEKGIVHGDIKPENIMITAANQVKLLDFGLARHLPGEDGSTAAFTMSMHETVGGTPSYMPPEVLLGGLPDRRADVFALGLVFYEMLTANHPFRGPSLASTSDRILHEEPRPLHKLGRHVPKDLAALIAKALSKSAEWRYASAKELAADLHAVIDHVPVKISGPPRQLPRKTIAALASALVLATVIVGVRPLRQRTVAFFSAGSQRLANPAPQEAINLAVLPMQVAGSDPELKAFGDGLAESVTAKLSQLSENHSLQVVTPAQMLAKKITTADQAMQSFGSNRGLKITLERSGDLLRANYMLLDSKTGNTIAGGNVTAPATDPFALEDKVADGVVSALHIKLHTDERSMLTAHGTAQPAANDYYLQGLGYLQAPNNKTENAANALAVLDQAIQLDSQFGLAYAAHGQADLLAYEQNKSPKLLKTAAADCAKAIDLGNAGARGHICSGSLATQNGDYPQAATEYKRAVELDPTNDDAYIGLGQSYEKLHRLDEAEQIYQQLISQRPQYWRGYDLLAQFYIKQAQYEKAIPLFRKVTELAPESYLNYADLAAAYLYIGQPAQAIPLLQHSIKVRPNTRAYSNLGTAYYQLKQFDNAAGNYEQATKLDSTDYALWGNLGDAYQAEGKREPAKQAYATELELIKPQLQTNPHDTELQTDIAAAYANVGDKQNALKYLDQSLSRAGDDKDRLLNAAVIYNQLGETGLALEWLDKALAAGYSPSVVETSQSLENLRGNTRFQQLLAHYAPAAKK